MLSLKMTMHEIIFAQSVKCDVKLKIKAIPQRIRMRKF